MSMIREVERDRDGAITVAIETGSEDVVVPPPCAACMGTAAKRLPVAGVNWIEFPYCDACLRVEPGALARWKRMRMLLVPVIIYLAFFVSLLFLLAIVFVLDLGGPRGRGVEYRLSESDVVRLGFRNEEYARLFVEANGGTMP
jgi:hypothetical protein